MAIVTGNPVLSGFSGTLGGNLVFRKYGDKTIVSVKREPRRTRRNRPSILQQMGHDKFREASKYARQLFRDPDKHDYYKKLAKKQGKHSAYNLVISEYMRRMKISTEDDAYSVKKSAKRVKLKVDKGGYTVKEVAVSVIRNGHTIHEGMANRISGNNWVYAAHELMEAGDVLAVQATDRFGTVSLKDFIAGE